MPPYDWFPEDMPMANVISIHLSGNFYPPLPQDYVQPVLQAIDLCKAGDYHDDVVIPLNINPVPRQAQEHEDGWHIAAVELLDILRLDVGDYEEA